MMGNFMFACGEGVMELRLIPGDGENKDESLEVVVRNMKTSEEQSIVLDRYLRDRLKQFLGML